MWPGIGTKEKTALGPHLTSSVQWEWRGGGWVGTGEATATPPQINSEELKDREQMDSLYKANVLGPYA